MGKLFDSSMIAKRALERASELKEDRKRKLNIIQNGAKLCALTAVLVSAIYITNSADETQTVRFESTPIPLAAAPIVHTNVCSECETEPNEDCVICKE